MDDEARANLRLGVIAYNFPHRKTHDGLLGLFLNGFKPKCVLAADPVRLGFYQSKVRVAPRGLAFPHPSRIAESLGIPYHVVVHNSDEASELVSRYRLDASVILGARILRRELISSHKVGILNLHPGLIPENRGLDNLKWAILRDLPMGVTAHLIGEKIDHGRLIIRRSVPVYDDDTLVDVHLRLQNTELVVMGEALDRIAQGERDFPPFEGEGTYFQAVPPEEEARLSEAFADYKRRHAAG